MLVRREMLMQWTTRDMGKPEVHFGKESGNLEHAVRAHESSTYSRDEMCGPPRVHNRICGSWPDAQGPPQGSGARHAIFLRIWGSGEPQQLFLTPFLVALFLKL